MKQCRVFVMVLGVLLVRDVLLAHEPPSDLRSEVHPAQNVPGSRAGLPTGHTAILNSGAFFAEEGGIVQLVSQVRRVREQFRERNAKLESMKQRLEALTGELQKQGTNLTPSARAQREDELESLKLDGQYEEQKFNQDLNRAMESAAEPVRERINAFLDTYCRERSIVLVLETTALIQARGLLFVNPALDITKDFISAYNKSTGGAVPGRP